MPLFVTNRLYFRSFESTDLAELARISADPVGSQYVGDGQPLTLAETAQWIENSRRNTAQYGYGTGAVVRRVDDQLIGWAGIARPGDGTEEIIYGLDRSHWGQGYGTEILQGLIHWATTELGLRALRATVDPNNAASINMLAGAGFELRTRAYGGDPDSDLYCLDLTP